MMKKEMAFHQLVKMISQIKTEEDKFEAFGAIDDTFNHDKISWSDHELLYMLAARIEIKTEG